MRTSLFELLVTAVAGAAGAACGLVEADCPRRVVDKTFDFAVDPAALCEGRRTTSIGDVSSAECRKLCNDARVTECRYGAEYRAAVTALLEESQSDGGVRSVHEVCPLPPRVPERIALTCTVSHAEGHYQSGCPIEGRRPAGYDSEPLRSSASATVVDAVARYLVECARLESASIVAFERLEVELTNLYAPATLLARTRSARADEVRHARDVAALAARFGGVVAPIVVPAFDGVRTVFAMALENVIEGVVRETFGAAIAIHRSAYAADPTVREAMTAIAVDECCHASLAFALDEWFRARLGPDEIARLDGAVRDAIDSLYESAAIDPAPELATALGLASASTARAILDRIGHSVWNRDPSHIDGRAHGHAALQPARHVETAL